MSTRDCRLLRSPGDVIALRWIPRGDSPGEELIERAAGALGALASVMEAIGIDLVTTFREADGPFLVEDEAPDPCLFHLREADPPTHVAVERGDDRRLLLATAPRLDEATVAAWINEAIARPTAPVGLAATLAVLDVRFARARLLDAKRTGAPALRLDVGSEVAEVPIEQRDGESWVSGPPLGLRILPPIALEVINVEGSLRAKVLVSWSCWATRGHAEHDALEHALRGLVARGWTPELVPPDFDLGARVGR